MILLALTRYKLPLELLAAFALLAGLLYGFHEFCERERDIGRNEARAEYAQKLVEAKAAADKREKELQGQVADAVDKGYEREQTLRTVAAGSSAASAGLRDALGTIRNGVPSATVDALRDSTSTLTTVLADCTGRYRALAEIADRHASDTKTLTDSWPRNEAVK
jgi:hypothetical protein